MTLTDTKRLGVIGAMAEEVELLKASLTEKEEHETASVKFVTGILEGMNVVLAQSGIGKINAALCTQLMLDQFHPSAVIFTGVAGGLIPGCKVGDLVLATHTVQHDYDISVFRGQKGFVPHPLQLMKEDPELYEKIKQTLSQSMINRLEGVQLVEADLKLRALACRAYDDAKKEGENLPPLYAGVIASGDQFISSNETRQLIQREFGALCAEMEGAATAYVCFLNNMPFMVLRALSDTADGEAVENFPKFCAQAAQVSATIVKRMASLMSHSLEDKVEIEYKWILDTKDKETNDILKSVTNFILSHGLIGADWSNVVMQNRYFDTKNFTLAQKGMVLRMREMPEEGCSLSCKLPGERQEARFWRPKLKRLIPRSIDSVGWKETLRDILGGTSVKEEIQKIADSSGVDLAEIWNSRCTLRITNNRFIMAVPLGYAGLIHINVDQITFSDQDLTDVPARELEIEIEIIRQPTEDKNAEKLKELTTSLPTALGAKASSESKYVRGIEELKQKKLK